MRGNLNPLAFEPDAQHILLGDGADAELRRMVVDDSLEIGHGRLQKVSAFLRAARGPIGEPHALRHLTARQFELRFRAVDGLLRERDALTALAENVERPGHVREGVDVARVGLSGPEVLVAKLELRIGQQSRLTLASFGDGDAFGFGFEQGSRPEGRVNRLLQAQSRLRPRRENLTSLLSRRAACRPRAIKSMPAQNTAVRITARTRTKLDRNRRRAGEPVR